MTQIRVVQADITTLDVDAIINAANSSLLGGSGVDGAIHRSAGPELLQECRGLNGCETGEAKITKGYRLPARHIIHTVGPVYRGTANDASLLSQCYSNCLRIAHQYQLKSIAFPAISCGVYGYPIDQAASIAVDTVCEELKNLEDAFEEVIFCCFSSDIASHYRTALARHAL